MPLFTCNISKYKFKSCLRDSFQSLLKIFIPNINLQLILQNISRGVKRIPPNVQTSISTGGHCWLKSSDSGREPLTGLTSGPKICSKLN